MAKSVSFQSKQLHLLSILSTHNQVSNSIFTKFALIRQAIRSKHALKIKLPEFDWTSGSHSCIGRQMYSLNYGDIGTNAVPGDRASWVQSECFRGSSAVQRPYTATETRSRFYETVRTTPTCLWSLHGSWLQQSSPDASLSNNIKIQLLWILCLLDRASYW